MSKVFLIYILVNLFCHLLGGFFRSGERTDFEQQCRRRRERGDGGTRISGSSVYGARKIVEVLPMAKNGRGEVLR